MVNLYILLKKKVFKFNFRQISKHIQYNVIERQ